MSFDLVHIWSTMGLAAKIVAGTLVLMAVAMIGVFFERLIALSRSNKESRRFAQEATLRIEQWDLAGLIDLSVRHKHSALARLFGAIAKRYQRGLEEGEGGMTPVELARNESARKREAVGAELRRGMPVLASVGSVAPFVGLLGTVLGIIGAFQGIAATGGGGLGAVSAGIAEALIETAFGLAVAIPAVLMFNYLTSRVSTIELALERSAGELLDEMEDRYGHKRGRLAVNRSAAA